ncbi:hypothetical protein [Treponema succinifaciens]|uniref:hypothetical protein n=1 Tax=Treponema succinifaciens TaxID=167 RepID=UPI0023F2D2B1|nr:hypothetical protein [Treponema succinifaciens]
MVSGIRAHTEELAKVSLGEEQAALIEGMFNKIRDLDSKQEKLKADLKSCTAELTEQTKLLGKEVLDAKKRVKLTIPQSGWKEFGITDKK